MSHPSLRLDNAVHQRTRLGILSLLAGANRVDFVFLRNTLALTDGNLSRNLSVLEGSGYISVEKGFEGRRHGHGSPSPRPEGRRWPRRSRPSARSSRPSSGTRFLSRRPPRRSGNALTGAEIPG